MITSIDFSRFELALSSPRGWIELALTLACIGLAWLVDRRIGRLREANVRYVRLPGSVVRVAFPLLAALLVWIAHDVWRRIGGPPFFLAIAGPILVALAVIRVLVFALRRLFPAQSWLPTWELAIGTTVWGLAVLYFLGVLPEIGAALDSIAIPLGKREVSLLTIFEGFAVVVATIVGTLWASGLIEQRLAVATNFDPNLRVVLGKVIRAVLITVGVLVALEQVGFDLTLLSVFGGALGVGIGLGLQKLASNYIAGFAILLDRSIRIGDLITVDNRQGTVVRATSRYVVLRGGDGVEAIVPNETLVTTTVLNHSYTSHVIRVIVQIQASYASDVERALALLTEVAMHEPRVLHQGHPPEAFLTAFGESGIALELAVWIDDARIGQQTLRSALNRAILKAFAENGIEIPYPQRDVRIVGAIPAGSASGANAPPSDPSRA